MSVLTAFIFALTRPDWFHDGTERDQYEAATRVGLFVVFAPIVPIVFGLYAAFTCVGMFVNWLTPKDDQNG